MKELDKLAKDLEYIHKTEATQGKLTISIELRTEPDANVKKVIDALRSALHVLDVIYANEKYRPIPGSTMRDLIDKGRAEIKEILGDK